MFKFFSKKEEKISVSCDQSKVYQFFGNLLDAIPYPFFYKDKEGKYLGCNKQFEDFLGRKKSEIVGKTVFELSPKKLAEIYYQQDNDLFKKGGVQIYESVVVKKDGTKKDVMFNKAIFFDEKNKPAGMVGVIVDITESKKIEEEVKQKNELLVQIEKVAKIGGWNFDVDTLNQIWTDEVYQIHEVDKKTFNPTVDKGINFYAPNSKPIIELAVKKAIELGESFDLELEIITAKGNHRFVRAIGQVEQFGGKTKKVYGIFQDITSNKKNEEKYKILFESSQDAIMVLEPPNWHFTSGNQATLKLFGLKDVEQLKSLGPADFSPEVQPDGQKSLDKSLNMINLTIKKGSNFFEWMHKKYQGKDFFATVLLTKVEIGSEYIIQATVRDITAEKEKINELEKMNKLLVGRELKMVELKEKIKKLENKTDENKK